ncbi:MAG: 3'-5' exonuclease [Bacteroidota bacterium]
MTSISTPYEALISKEELSTLPLDQYTGVIQVIDQADDVAEAMTDVNDQTFVGFDTETKPVFVKGQHNDVSLAQIAIPGKVILIRLNQTGIPDELVSFFENEDILKIGIAQQRDISDLRKLREFCAAGFVNLDEEVSKIGIESNGLRKLAGIILGIKISKSAQTSNWEADRLSSKQLTYAATDAWVCRKMYERVQPYLEQAQATQD